MNSGQIAIAAKKLLNHETEHWVLGALAHELCHFAMHLLHQNDAKPYAKEDEVS
jgi:predicted SprT family Zn-dependent metalloprotease